MRRSLVIVVLACLMVPLSGCSRNGRPGVEGTGERISSGDAVLWPFWPVRMAVHPASRLTINSDTGARHYEARIAFYDRFGDICKAVGEMRLELQDPHGERAIMPEWTVDLRKLDLNRQHYDDVTRTYLFKLRIEEEMTPETARLQVYFLSDDGQLFSLDQDVRLR